MPKRLEFISYSIVRRDPDRFKAQLREQYPTFSAEDLEKVATVELWKHKPRLDHTEVNLFGHDVLTDDVTTIASWDDLSAKSRRFVRRHQADGTLAQIIAIPGLSRSYVWNKRNAWVQEVADADLALIRDAKQTREMAKRGIAPAGKWFRDIDVYGPWPGFPQTWELPVADRFAARNLDDAAAFVRDVRKTKQWPGHG